MNHNLIVLDPAHGGPETGATLSGDVAEKDVTLAIAGHLRSALASAGFTVVTTRDADPPDPLPTDNRAELANRTHAVACIVVHATATGSGVHLYTSTLQPSEPAPVTDDQTPPPFTPVAWDSAQAASVEQSQRMANELRSALVSGGLPVVLSKAPLRPLDNLMCPAVALEIAPLPIPGGDITPPTDANYQQHIAATVATALRSWKTHADPLASATAADWDKALAPSASQALAVPQRAASAARSQPRPTAAPAPPAQKGAP